MPRPYVPISERWPDAPPELLLIDSENSPIQRIGLPNRLMVIFRAKSLCRKNKLFRAVIGLAGLVDQICQLREIANCPDLICEYPEDHYIRYLDVEKRFWKSVYRFTLRHKLVVHVKTVSQKDGSRVLTLKSTLRQHLDEQKITYTEHFAREENGGHL